jgi:hypothetical protein
VPTTMILLHNMHVPSPGTSIFLSFRKGHLFLFPFHHTLYKTTLTFNQCHLMHFYSSFRCLSIFSVHPSRILSIAIEMQTLLQFYVSTLCIDLSIGKIPKESGSDQAIVTDIWRPVFFFALAPHYSEYLVITKVN